MAVLFIRDQDGKFVPIPALSGVKGDTPVRGVDYWTEEDVKQIQGYIDDQMADVNDEIDKLSEEKADKKDIPAPYILPTASAEGKGGVKINPNDFVMDGDVLSAKQKKYELLYDTTVNDTGKNTVFTHTADGREFYFSSVLLAVNAGEHDAANDDSTRFCCPPSPDQYWKDVVQLIWVAGMRANLSFWQEVYLDKGIWWARWTDPAHNKDMSNQRTCNTSNLDMTEEIYPAIKVLYFPTLPPGARIRIWGVWKDD